MKTLNGETPSQDGTAERAGHEHLDNVKEEHHLHDQEQTAANFATVNVAGAEAATTIATSAMGEAGRMPGQPSIQEYY